MRFGLAIIMLVTAPCCARAVTFDMVTIGNPSNSSDITAAGLFGRVTTEYQIGRTEVTNAQYVEFLNATAATDPYSLYNPSMGTFNDGGIVRTGASGAFTYSIKPTTVVEREDGSFFDYAYADKPVNYVTWYDAARFANWMNNGQGAASTETGAYTLLGGTPVPTNADDITRNAGATWFLPSENQWYKAAYYDAATASYFDYPTGSNSAPNNNLPSAAAGNSANFLVGTTTTTGDPSVPLSDAGAYTLSDSPYGTLDQGGNVGEWNEAKVSAGKRGRRGGAWNTTELSLSAETRDSMSAGLDNNSTGFRMARLVPAAGVAGDYNGNGTVDAADYVVWRNNLGASLQLQNEVAGTTPGTVTQEDYDAWRARFGNTSGAGAGEFTGTAVPEASTAVLAALAGILVAFRRRSNGRVAT